MNGMPAKVSYMFEVSQRCNQRCTFCYNAWRPRGEPNKKELSTAQARHVLERVIRETPCHSISLSGGEPMLRSDIFDLIAFIKSQGVRVCLISNGALLSEDAIERCLSSGVDVFQITLLSEKPEVHNTLTGVDGFENALEAVLNIKKRGGTVHVFFVALSANIESFGGVMELCVLLGVDNVSFGRFLPGGSGLAQWRTSLPSPGAIERALQAADEVSGRYRLPVSVSNPILPCLNDVSRYKHVRFSFCAAGRKDHAFFAIDPEGNLKVCSHSPQSLGNLLERSFAEIVEHPFYQDFQGEVPEFCRDCGEVGNCRGGCRSAAHVCFGSLKGEDPYLSLWKSGARKPPGVVFETPCVGCEEIAEEPVPGRAKEDRA